MSLREKIVVHGHTGLLGSAIVQKLKKEGRGSLILKTHRELDLTDAHRVNQFYSVYEPTQIYLCAAKVGGMYANIETPADFISENLSIQNNVLQAAWHYGVHKLLFVASAAVYPEKKETCSEEDLLTGKLDMTKAAYGIAKIAGIQECLAFNKQHHTKFISVIPNNLYGIGDNFNPSTSHVVPGIIRKIHEAKINKLPTCEMWGSGNAKRELIFNEDAADACIFLMNNKETPLDTPVNIGVGYDVTIKLLANTLAEIIGYDGTLTWNDTFEEGTQRRLLNIDKIKKLGWKPTTSLMNGLKETYLYWLGTLDPKDHCYIDAEKELMNILSESLY